MRDERRSVRADVVIGQGVATARVVLEANGRLWQGLGTVRCAPGAADPVGVGEDLALGRALVDLGARLVRDAARRIESIEGRPAALEA